VLPIGRLVVASLPRVLKRLVQVDNQRVRISEPEVRDLDLADHLDGVDINNVFVAPDPLVRALRNRPRHYLFSSSRSFNVAVCAAPAETKARKANRKAMMPITRAAIATEKTLLGCQTPPGGRSLRAGAWMALGRTLTQGSKPSLGRVALLGRAAGMALRASSSKVVVPVISRITDMVNLRGGPLAIGSADLAPAPIAPENPPTASLPIPGEARLPDRSIPRHSNTTNWRALKGSPLLVP